jgi:acyl-CoA synthetase (AMP-forming)/AMP-acid ligase II
MLLPFDIEPDAPLLLRGGERITRADVGRRSAQLAADLMRLGVTRLLVASDRPSCILAAFEASSLTCADLWIAHADLPSRVIDDAAREHEIGLILTDDQQHTTGVGPVDASSRICLMTSGTTGRPKVAAYTRARLLDRFVGQTSLAALANSRWLLTYQPTTFAGLQVLLTAVYARGILVVAESRTAVELLNAAQRHAVTHVSGTPTFWRSLLIVAGQGMLPDLRQATLGGEAVDQTTLDRIRIAFPQARITHIYASTEAGVVFSVNDARAGFPAAWLTEGVQGARLRIRNGVLEVRAPRRMTGYIGHGVETPFIEDGWLRTSDRVTVDDDRVHFLGRLDSVINVGGSKVDPFSVEAFLLGLDEVAEARVVGVRNQVSGFIVAADIVLRPGCEPGQARDRIQAECYNRLPRTHVPRLLRIVDAIRVLESGKKAV